MSHLYNITADYLMRSDMRVLHAGDDYEHTFTTTRAGSPLDLSGATIWFTIKQDTNDADTEAKLQYVSTDTTEIEITDGPAGEFTIKLKDTDTANLEGTWNYDIKTLLSSGDIIRLARGIIQFLPNITQAFS